MSAESEPSSSSRASRASSASKASSADAEAQPVFEPRSRVESQDAGWKRGPSHGSAATHGSRGRAVGTPLVSYYSAQSEPRVALSERSLLVQEEKMKSGILQTVVLNRGFEMQLALWTPIGLLRSPFKKGPEGEGRTRSKSTFVEHTLLVQGSDHAGARLERSHSEGLKPGFTACAASRGDDFFD
mmetsp:Transcript_8234/g.18013  ORF Transcript_8234/g.18013 Transcript_8234/m.18013 type:complete len:185 (+) Transcript_8234:2327-2881(+)